MGIDHTKFIDDQEIDIEKFVFIFSKRIIFFIPFQQRMNCLTITIGQVAQSFAGTLRRPNTSANLSQRRRPAGCGYIWRLLISARMFTPKRAMASTTMEE